MEFNKSYHVELWFPGDTEKENHVFHYLLGCREVVLLLAKPVPAYGPVLVRKHNLLRDNNELQLN